VVSQPARDIAESAWRMLQALIAGKKLKARHLRLPPSLIVRGSTEVVEGTASGESSPASAPALAGG
jgi:DNA-binding LacI/PurR family transcriptional regulator